MATLSIRQVRFEQLQNKGRNAAIVVKLMMACNDLSLANQALDDWKRPATSTASSLLPITRTWNMRSQNLTPDAL